jgi:hypothetical protein
VGNNASTGHPARPLSRHERSSARSILAHCEPAPQDAPARATSTSPSARSGRQRASSSGVGARCASGHDQPPRAGLGPPRFRSQRASSSGVGARCASGRNAPLRVGLGPHAKRLQNKKNNPVSTRPTGPAAFVPPPGPLLCTKLSGRGVHVSRLRSPRSPLPRRWIGTRVLHDLVFTPRTRHD